MNRQLSSSLAVAAASMGGWLVLRSLLRRHRRWSLRDSVVLITGGSRGLGLLMARELARQHAKIAICARDEEELQRAASELRRRGAEVYARACDVADKDSVDEFVDGVVHELGPVDVLINNAGIIQVGPWETMTRDDFAQAMDVHFWGCLNTIGAVLPQMRRRRGGRIVNISSIGGKISVPHLLPYCASKFALIGLSRGLRAELLKENILVTTVCPGLMRTGSHVQAQFKGKHRHEFTWFSLGASMPLVSIKAERAAQQILAACRDGRAELTISLPAKLATVAQSIAPEVTAELMALQARLLPDPNGSGEHAQPGFSSRPSWPLEWLTVLGERAARRNNELGS